MIESLRDALLIWLSTSLVPSLLSVLPSLLKAVVIAIATLVLAGRASAWFRVQASRRAIDPSTMLLGARLMQVAVIALGLTFVLDSVGIPPSALLAAIGVVGLAVSLALQDLLRNFFSGIYLLFERPFRIGDVVRVKDHEGTVEHVGFRTTVLRSEENVEVLIPNSLVVAEVVTNRTYARQEAAREPAAPPTASDGSRADS